MTWGVRGAAAPRTPCCVLPGCLRPHGCSGRRRARPPARSPHASLAARSGRSRSPPVPSGPSDALHASEARSLIGGSARRLEARPGPAAAHGHRSQALPFLAGSRTPATLSLLCVACPAHHSAISHVIPLRIVYTFNLHRWNCNVCGPSRKMTELNYVRLLGGTHQPRTNPFPAPASHTPITQKCRT